ncbi:SirB2 family protein [Alteromonas sp. 5E99-2]|uniref:SirB2 family protein n=1 Tax=Alteromonas sp. 5E99-2 TaxID=2817683 RepID=UPI001A991F56|nr:SirB2 family protein [Alteromonas sp. 5E99-2]MBO1255496.1 SirB2 family protein [Alteromonas sp. 5E99-2]
MYEIVKHIHITAVMLSILVFIGRFLLLQFVPRVGNHKILKIVPHVLYTVLLISAIVLCSLIGVYPLADTWATQKLIGLVAFAVIGLYSTKWAKTKSMAWGSFFIVLVFLVMTLHVAFSKQPLFF